MSAPDTINALRTAALDFAAHPRVLYPAPPLADHVTMCSGTAQPHLWSALCKLFDVWNEADMPTKCILAPFLKQISNCLTADVPTKIIDVMEHLH